jgi:mRNA interferase MazF
VAESYVAGDIVYARFPAPIKDRPVLVLSRGEINAVRENIVVAFVTRTIRRIPLEVPVGKEEGLPKSGVVSLGDIHTIPRALMGPIRGRLSPEKLFQAQKGLTLLFNLQRDHKTI